MQFLIYVVEFRNLLLYNSLVVSSVFYKNYSLVFCSCCSVKHTNKQEVQNAIVFTSLID